MLDLNEEHHFWCAKCTVFCMLNVSGLLYSVMYQNTLRLSYGNTNLSETVWPFK